LKLSLPRRNGKSLEVFQSPTKERKQEKTRMKPKPIAGDTSRLQGREMIGWLELAAFRRNEANQYLDPILTREELLSSPRNGTRLPRELRLEEEVEEENTRTGAEESRKKGGEAHLAFRLF